MAARHRSIDDWSVPICDWTANFPPLFMPEFTLFHLHAVARQQAQVQRFLLGGIDAEFAQRGIDGIAHRP